MKKIILCLLLLKGVVYAGKPSNFKLPLVVSKDSVEIVRLPKDFDHLSVRDFTISPKNDEIFFTVESNKNTIATIMQLCATLKNNTTDNKRAEKRQTKCQPFAK